jgi:hypothetical protein
MPADTPPNTGASQPVPKPLIAQVEQVTAPWIEGIQGVGQDNILKEQLPKPPGQ